MYFEVLNTSKMFQAAFIIYHNVYTICNKIQSLSDIPAYLNLSRFVIRSWTSRCHESKNDEDNEWNLEKNKNNEYSDVKSI